MAILSQTSVALISTALYALAYYASLDGHSSKLIEGNTLLDSTVARMVGSDQVSFSTVAMLLGTIAIGVVFDRFGARAMYNLTHLGSQMLYVGALGVAALAAEGNTSALAISYMAVVAQCGTFLQHTMLASSIFACLQLPVIGSTKSRAAQGMRMAGFMSAAYVVGMLAGQHISNHLEKAAAPTLALAAVVTFVNSMLTSTLPSTLVSSEISSVRFMYHRVKSDTRDLKFHADKECPALKGKTTQTLFYSKVIAGSELCQRCGGKEVQAGRINTPKGSWLTLPLLLHVWIFVFLARYGRVWFLSQAKSFGTTTVLPRDWPLPLDSTVSIAASVVLVPLLLLINLGKPKLFALSVYVTAAALTVAPAFFPLLKEESEIAAFIGVCSLAIGSVLAAIPNALVAMTVPRNVAGRAIAVAGAIGGTTYAYADLVLGAVRPIAVPVLSAVPQLSASAAASDSAIIAATLLLAAVFAVGLPKSRSKKD